MLLEHPLTEAIAAMTPRVPTKMNCHLLLLMWSEYLVWTFRLISRRVGEVVGSAVG